MKRLFPLSTLSPYLLRKVWWILLVLLQTTTLQAWDWIGEEFMVDTSITTVPAQGQQSHSVVIQNGEEYIVVWQDGRDGISSCIYGTKVSANREVIDPSGIAISTVMCGQESPSIASGSSSFLTVWVDARLSPYTPDIYGARIDSEGVVIDTQSIPISIASNNQDNPALAFDGENYLVVWQDRRDLSSNYDIYCTRVRESGVVLDTSGIPICSCIGKQINPAIVFCDSCFMVAWEDYRNDTLGWYAEIYAARVTSDGTLLDTSGIRIDSTRYYNGSPSVSFDGTNCFVAWKANGLVLGVRVALDGSVLDEPIPITTSGNYFEYTSICFGDSNYFIVWNEYIDGIHRDDVFGARVSMDGLVLDIPPIAIVVLPRNQVSPSVAYNDSIFIVSWADWRNENFDIYGTGVTREGIVLDPPGVVISTVVSQQWYPSVAFNGANYLVCWQNWLGESITDIWGIRINENGVPQDSASLRIFEYGGWEYFPSSASDGTDYFVVFQSGYCIYGVRIGQDGAILDSSGIILSDSSRWGTYPAVAFGDSEYLVVWADYTDYNIHGKRVSQDGTVLDSSFILICGAYYSQMYPSVSYNGTNYLVVWTDWRFSGLPDIYGTRVSPNGTVLDPSGICISDASNTQWEPCVATDGNGYLVCWRDSRNGNDYDIYSARVNGNGAVLDVSGIPVCTEVGNQYCPSVTFDEINYLVVWEDCRNSPGDTSNIDIYAATITPGGVKQEEFTISDSQGNQKHPTTTYSSDTTCLIAWRSYAEPPYDTYRIFAVLFRETGIEERDLYNPSHLFIRCFPNPFSKKCDIEFGLPNKEFVTLSIYDISGRKVKTLVSKLMDQGNQRKSFQLSSLPGGIYFLRMDTEKESITEKLIVVR